MHFSHLEVDHQWAKGATAYGGRNASTFSCQKCPCRSQVSMRNKYVQKALYSVWKARSIFSAASSLADPTTAA
jgi:hypothetical protein